MEDQDIARTSLKKSEPAKLHTEQLLGAEVCVAGLPGRYGGGMLTKASAWDASRHDVKTDYEAKAAKMVLAERLTRICN